MSKQTIHIDAFKNIPDSQRISIHSNLYKDDWVLVDVRSPAEYLKGHIPTAINIPLFTNEERAEIGILYKEKGKQQAVLKGLELAGSKLHQFAKEAFRLSKGRPLFCYCWRGGMRSASMAWLFNMAGIQTHILEGGYKAYRNFVLNGFQKMKLQILILGGKTGIGKTKLLMQLKQIGEPVLDLEGIAHHKGSAFGWIGEEVQNTNEQFENNLHKELASIESQYNYVWLENESRSIGSNFIPEALWNQMKSSVLIDVQRSLERRVEILVESYATTNAQDLILSFQKIEKRLGHEATAKAIQAIEVNNLREAAAIALFYYDKCYTYNLEQNQSPEIIHCTFGDNSEDEIIDELLRYKNIILNGKEITH
ncbi:MAG: tRNA 2-selenouridine(34) synthase MnmH [Saprospiraceae bacterium]|nr:tRNA 2-selenouridine(34) synthase MnmH [Saprospiraceae bacterium]